MPGTPVDKATPAMEVTSTAATPFRVTVSTVSVELRVVLYCTCFKLTQNNNWLHFMKLCVDDCISRIRRFLLGDNVVQTID